MSCQVICEINWKVVKWHWPPKWQHTPPPLKCTWYTVTQKSQTHGCVCCEIYCTAFSMRFARQAVCLELFINNLDLTGAGRIWGLFDPAVSLPAAAPQLYFWLYRRRAASAAEWGAFTIVTSGVTPPVVVTSHVLCRACGPSNSYFFEPITAWCTSISCSVDENHNAPL